MLKNPFFKNKGPIFISEIVEVDEEVYGLRIGEHAKKRPCLSFDRVSYDNLQQIIGILS